MEYKKISNLATYVNKVQEVVTELSQRHCKFLEKEPLIAFRGESKDYGVTKLTPSLFRNADYVNKEMHLFELFCDYNIVDRTASNVEKAIETQHYASISRMLDISFDVLVALYFACMHEKNNDGYIYIFVFPEHYSPHSKYVEEFYTHVLEGKHIAYSRNFKVFSHSYTNDRIRAQKGGFIFFPGNEFQPISNCYYERICISKEHKNDILHDLEMFFQINTATLFPEKDKIADIVKKKFDSNTYLSKDVTLKSEITTFLNRIDYEMKILNYKGEVQSGKDALRYLRKEEDDIIKYIINHAGKEDKLLINAIEKGFKTLRIRYMEVLDE